VLFLVACGHNNKSNKFQRQAIFASELRSTTQHELLAALPIFKVPQLTMAQVYNLEPQPTAKVTLSTTSGDLELELFAKQIPLAARNFLQLCLDGYYDGTIFHRLVPGFIIQGGDPSATGHGGEAIYEGGLFADEFHSRIKFNRRGLLGMANSGKKDDNGSQFFLTLGSTPELEGKNTMFGRIVGDTIYNLMKMADAELMDDGSERPIYPTKILSTVILINPFEDMVEREKKIQVDTQGKADKKKSKKKAGKALLSFGDDGDIDMVDAPAIKKAKFNTKLVSGSNGHGATGSVTEEQTNPQEAVKPRKIIPRRRDSPSPVPEPKPAIIRSPSSKAKPISRSPSSSPEPVLSKEQTRLDRTNAQIEELKASMRRNVINDSDKKPKRKSTLEEMIPKTSIRGRKRKHGANTEDDKAWKLLNQWKRKLENAPTEGLVSTKSASDETTSGKQPADTAADDEEASLCDLHFIANCLSCQAWDKEGADDDTDITNDADWMSHKLTFEKDRLGKDLEWKRKNEEELVVIDPREKEKELKEERKAKKKRP
jgi:peptidyl-prolyl cis-trans isomerase SDCCAG10